jgi:hypothetical protein
LAPAIASLTIDPKTGKPPLDLGPLNNAKYLAQNASGNSSAESRNFASLQRSIQEATNLKTDAAKGVQNMKDVLSTAKITYPPKAIESEKKSEPAKKKNS